MRAPHESDRFKTPQFPKNTHTARRHHLIQNTPTNGICGLANLIPTPPKNPTAPRHPHGPPRGGRARHRIPVLLRGVHDRAYLCSSEASTIARTFGVVIPVLLRGVHDRAYTWSSFSFPSSLACSFLSSFSFPSSLACNSLRVWRAASRRSAMVVVCRAQWTQQEEVLMGVVPSVRVRWRGGPKTARAS